MKIIIRSNISIGFLATRLKFKKRAERYILGAGILALIAIFLFATDPPFGFVALVDPVRSFPLYFMMGIVWFSNDRYKEE